MECYSDASSGAEGLNASSALKNQQFQEFHREKVLSLGSLEHLLIFTVQEID